MSWHGNNDERKKYQPNFLFNSDTEIYNALLDAKKSNHMMLKHFNIMYPNKIPQNPVNAIYVGRLDTVFHDDYDSFDHYEWEVSTEIYITTKQYDKVDRYRMLKTATFAVMEVLLNSKIGSFLEIENQSFIYDNNNLLQMSRITVKTKENTYVDNIKNELKHICGILAELDVEGTMHKENEKDCECEKQNKGEEDNNG